MMHPRWHKVGSDLRGNWVRSLLVIASVAVGLFAIGIIGSLYFLISEDMRASYMAVNPTNILINSLGFTQEFVDRISHLPEVKEAEGVHLVNVRVRTGPDEWKSMELRAVDDPPNRKINQLLLVEGSWPSADHEMVVDRYKFPDLDTPIGGTIEVKLPSGKIRQIKLSGVVHDQTIGIGGLGGGFFLSPLQGYISTDALDWLEEPDTFNQLLVTVKQGNADEVHIRQVAGKITDEFDENNLVAVNSVVRRSTDHPNSNYIDAIAIILFILGMLVVFLSSFLITNTLSALLNQQVQQIGIMKVLGGRRNQIITLYMVLILVFSALALFVALPLSDRASYRLVEFLALQTNFRPQGYRTIPAVHALLIFLAMAVPQAAGIFPILRGVGISPNEAISGISREGGESQKGWLDRALGRVRRLSRPTLISLRNAFRRKGRLALTLVTLSLGGAIFIATFSVQSSLNGYVDRLSKYFIADVSLAFDQSYRTERIQRDLLDLPGIDQVEGWAVTRCELDLGKGQAGDIVTLMAPPASSHLIQPILLSGRWIQPGGMNELAVNERFQGRFPGLKPGDTIQLKINGEEETFNVVGIFQFAGKSGGLMGYTSYETLSGILHTPNKASMYRITMSGSDHSMSAQLDMVRKIESHLSAKGYHLSEADAGKELLSRTSSGINVVITFLFIMAILTALVGSIGLTGTMSMNIMERTREIGIMRAIGASDRIVMNLVLVEGMVIGLLSWLIGGLLSYPIGLMMWNSLSMAIFELKTDYLYDMTGIFVWLGLVILLAVLASVMPARSAARITIREALAYE